MVGSSAWQDPGSQRSGTRSSQSWCDVGHCGHTAGREQSPTRRGRADVRDRGGGHVTYPPNVRTAPSRRRRRRPHSRPAPAAAARRRGAWAEGKERLRAAATTEPGRLQIIGAVLAAAGRGVRRGDRLADRRPGVRRRRRGEPQPAAERGRRGHLPLAGRRRHGRLQRLPGGRRRSPRESASGTRRTSTTASRLLVKAAANTGRLERVRPRRSPRSTSSCPRYTGLVERARANNRQGLPLGGAYLRYANEQMTQRAAARRRASCTTAETARLGEDDDDARVWPLVALGARRRSRWPPWSGRSAATTGVRTGCSTTVCSPPRPPSTVVAAVAGRRAHGGPRRAERRRRPRPGVPEGPQRRADQLAAGPRQREPDAGRAGRGRSPTDGKSDKYEIGLHARAWTQLGDAAERRRRSSPTTRGPRPRRRRPPRASAEWQERHKSARATDKAGDYDGALEQVIGAEGTRRASPSTRSTTALAKALDHEQREFTAPPRTGAAR